MFTLVSNRKLRSQMQLEERKFKKYIYFSLNKYGKLIKFEICCGSQGLNLENKKNLRRFILFQLKTKRG